MAQLTGWLTGITEASHIHGYISQTLPPINHESSQN